MSRDRSKPKHELLKDALEAVLSDPEQMSILATASIAPNEPGVWWDEDGPHFEDAADWDARSKNVEMHLRSVLAILTRAPARKKKSGGQTLPGEPDLTDLDRTILKLAREFAARTGKAAANGAVGRNITNQGGPFVKEAAAHLGLKEKAIIARIDRMEKHPRLNMLWNHARDPNWSEKAFGPALKNLGILD
jgi:hypothetical protein